MIAPVVFYKDLRVGFKHLLVAPAVLVIAYLGIEFVWQGHYGAVPTELEIARLYMSLLACFNCFIAIIIGGQVTAEEKNAGTNLFLARLPISKKHLYLEKVAAGLCGVTILYLASMAYLSFFDMDGVLKIEIFGSVPEYFFISMFSAYFISIACSRFTQQSVAIMLISFGAVCMIWGVIAVLRSTEAIDWYALRLAILFCLLFFVGPSILVWRQWQLPQRPHLWGSRHQRTQIRGLLWKAFAENGLLHLMCLLLMLATLALTSLSESIRIGDSVIGLFATLVGALLLAALGSSAYAANERHGLKCITYHHPVSRGLLFTTKLVVATPAIVMVAVSLALTVKATVPPILVFVVSVLLYLLAVQSCLMHQKGTVNVVLAGFLWMSFPCGIIFAWLTPSDNALFFDGFVPVHDPLLVALLPLSFLTLGSLFTNWRLATNRRLLAGSDVYRQRYTLVCFVAVGLVTSGLVSLIQKFVVL